jgi:hypothetical protein
MVKLVSKTKSKVFHAAFGCDAQWRRKIDSKGHGIDCGKADI